jgi:hypothetical protein
VSLYLWCWRGGIRRAGTDPVWLRYTNPAVAARFQELLPGCNLAAATEDRWSGGGTGSRTEPGRRRPGVLPGIRRAGPVTPALPDGGNPGLSGVRAVLVVPARMTRSGLLAYPRQNLSRPGADAPRHALTASASPSSATRSSAGPSSARQPGARSQPSAREHWHSPGSPSSSPLVTRN